MAKQETREMLTEAFFALYKEKPVRKISIREVTEKAGFHRSTFYEYFKDIYDILEQEEEEICKLQRELILERVEEGQIVIGEEAFLEPVKKLFELKGEKIAVLIGANGDTAFQKKLQDGIKKVIIPVLFQKSGARSDYVAEFISSGILSTYEIAYENKADIEDVMVTIYPMVSKLFGT